MKQVLLSFCLILGFANQVLAIDCEASFSGYVGTRRDSFFHLTIHDEIWAKTILPKSAFQKLEDRDSFRTLEITRGNSAFPDMMYGDDYVTYFDKLEVASVEGSREQGRILVYLTSGVSFEMIFNPGMRRRFELWVHGLTGSVRSKKILSAASGMEFSL